jgi:hypothetical protein
VPWLVVVHRPVASFLSAERTLTTAAAQVSAHALLGTMHRAVQLVDWDQKAWACEAFNAASYNIEVGDEAWDGRAPELLLDAARVVAFLCKRTGIPPTWSTSPTHKPGIVRHYDLGIAGGGHTDPTLDVRVWTAFVQRVAWEWDHGQFRPDYGSGELHRIDT